MWYGARRKGESLAKHRDDLARFYQEMHLPEDFQLHEALSALAKYDHRELERVDDLWNENVELEWSGPLIPVEDVSTPILNTDGVDCVVCRYSVTPPGLKYACNHIYCKSCLATWIHACTPASYTCPLCRTQLLEKRDYKPKVPELAMNYEHEVRLITRRRKMVEETAKSYRWLEQELKL
jgi:hypothetical protein